MTNDNIRHRALIRNLRLLGSMSMLWRSFTARPLPKPIRRIIHAVWRVKGITFYYKSARLPSATVCRLIQFREYRWLFECHLDSDIDRHVAIHGAWEPHILAFCQKFITPNSTVIDVGANIGIHSIAFAAFTGPQGRVISFEPSPDVLPRLTQNIQLNRITNIDLMPIAVSSHSTANATFYSPSGSNKGLGSLQKNIDLSESKQFAVNTVALDEISENFGPISLIKIDIQGHELDALHGMTNTIQRHRPVVIFELEYEYLSDPNTYIKNIHSYFANIGYQLYAIDGEFLYHLPTDTQFHGDVIAIPTFTQR